MRHYLKLRGRQFHFLVRTYQQPYLKQSATAPKGYASSDPSDPFNLPCVYLPTLLHTCQSSDVRTSAHEKQKGSLFVDTLSAMFQCNILLRGNNERGCVSHTPWNQKMTRMVPNHEKPQSLCIVSTLYPNFYRISFEPASSVYRQVPDDSKLSSV